MKVKKIDTIMRSSALSQVFYITIASFLLPNMAFSQSTYTPPPLPNKDVDDFYVELKSGRFVKTVPELVSVGDQSRKLTISFLAMDYESSNSTVYHGRISRPTSTTIAVDYSNNSETFHVSGRDTSRDAVVNYEPEILSGSTLRRTYNGSTYQYRMSTKEGVVYTYLPNSNPGVLTRLEKISYPDGYEIFVSPTYVYDNKGYMIKIHFDQQSSITSWQAINRTIDYCNSDIDSLCTATQSRVAKTFNSSAPGSTTWDRSFVNAAGETTVFKYVPIKFARDNGFDYLLLPAAVDLPGVGADEIKISYDYSNVGSMLQDDVMVKKVVKGEVIADYSYFKELINTGGYAARGFHLTASQMIAGTKRFETYSVTPPYSSASQRRTPSTMLTFKDAEGNKTSFQSDRFGRIAGATSPGGTFTSHTFDDRNNYTDSTSGGTGVQDLKTQRIFPTGCNAMDQAACNLPTSITDPRGSVINYQYNGRAQTTHVDTPAGNGGARSRTSNYYVLRTAMIKDVNGNIVAAGQPISLLDYSTTCAKSFPCDGNPDEIVTNYYYGPLSGVNNLNLKGISVTATDSDGVRRTQFVCYQYNYFGDLISETKQNAGMTSCS